MSEQSGDRQLGRNEFLGLVAAVAGGATLNACGVREEKTITTPYAANAPLTAIDQAANSQNLLPARSFTRKPRIMQPQFYPGETIRSIATSQNVMVFTFDDGPDKVHERAIASIFEERGYSGKAAWFFVGNNALANPDVVKEMYDRGYEICNHTKTHGGTGGYTSVGEAVEIGPTQDILQSITGEYPLFFRGAGGVMGSSINQELVNWGMSYIWTDGDEQDYIAPRILPDEINGHLIHYLHPGYISLRHSGGTHDNTVNAMHNAITIVENAGFAILSLREALEVREDGVGPSTAPSFINRLNNALPHFYDGADGPLGYDLAADMALVA